MLPQVMRLESHCVVSNRTGIPLQLMQWRSDALWETFDDKAGGGTLVKDSKGGLPRATSQTPAQPGFKAAVNDPAVDWTSYIDLPPGAQQPGLCSQVSEITVGTHMLLWTISRSVDTLGAADSSDTKKSLLAKNK